MALSGHPFVILDTDAWTWLHARELSPEKAAATKALRGRRFALSMISVGEIRKGALALGAKRQALLLANLDATPVYPIDQTVAVSYAHLWHEARQTGHAIHAKGHAADCWIAATAIALGVRLLTGDGLYRGAPGLSVEIIERHMAADKADP